MNKLKNTKVMLVLSVLLVIILIGSVSATDEISNEKVSTSQSDVDTLSQEVDSVDEGVSTTDMSDSVVNDTDNQKGLLSSDNDEDILQEVNSVDVSTYDELKNELGSGNKIINIMQDIDFGIQIPITVSNITINGNGHTFKQTSDRFFIVYNTQKIVFKNINFKDGYKYGTSITTYDNNGGTNYIAGGAIEFRGSQWCTVEFCNFTNCRSGYGGGAIHFQRDPAGLLPYPASDILITNCNFYNNEANYGGAIRGPSSQGTTRINITNCYFESNNARTGDGGGIEWKFTYSILDNCTFVNNTGSRSGAIGLFSHAGNSRFINSIFINNIARTNQASSAGALTIYDTNSPNCVVDNCTFIGNHAPNGGAFNTLSKNATVQNCIFINNIATFDGGAVLFSAQDSRLINCNFTNNSANEGGAVKFNGKNSYMGFCNFINNTATTDGGTLCAQSTGSVVEKCSFTNNTAPIGKDFYAHGNKIEFRGLKFDTLWLTNKYLESEDKIISQGFGTSYFDPAAWQDDDDFEGG
ncbi:MAG: right-handed parallel beta-helix repeat-containing protein, partial [Methanosphaera sp.]|nr:right-handed parallel beta-helix repeat-containing protein [Methanosphaera sp.]